MSVELPKGIRVFHDTETEALIDQRMDEWLDLSPRSPGLHASDLLDPLHSYWDREHPVPRDRVDTDRFFTGKLGEVALVNMLDGDRDEEGNRIVNPWAGGAQLTSEEFGLEYAPDYTFKETGIPCEIKTHRGKEPHTTLEDIRYWVEQCMVYCAMMGRNDYVLLIYYLCAQPGGKGPVISFRRPIRLWFPDDQLEPLKKHIKELIFHVKHCYEHKTPQHLTLCREWKCGEKMCKHWEVCKPEGRYGRKYMDWLPPDDKEMFEP